MSGHKAHTNPALPVQGFSRLCIIVGDKRKGIPPLLPISRTSFLNGVKSGKYPRPVKISERCTAWRNSDLIALLARLGNAS
jgi:predicted DNA-binding transcriptional regulator AlpA